MFKKKCVVIMYKTSTITGSYYITGRFVSYATLFLRCKEYLDNNFGDAFVITNVVKL